MTESIAFGTLGISFDDRVLRPRPWTAGQSSWARDLLRFAPAGPVLELCCGAGHIGLLAVVDEPRDLVMIDLDPVACEFARSNAAAAGLAARVDVRQGRVDEALRDTEHFALVIADPPWVPSRLTDQHRSDPLVAIDGGPDGLDLIWACVETIARHLVADGSAVLQVGSAAQAEAVSSRVQREASWGLSLRETRTFDQGVLLRLTTADRARG